MHLAPRRPGMPTDVLLNGGQNDIGTLHHAAAQHEQLGIVGVDQRDGQRGPNLQAVIAKPLGQSVAGGGQRKTAARSMCGSRASALRGNSASGGRASPWPNSTPRFPHNRRCRKGTVVRRGSARNARPDCPPGRARRASGTPSIIDRVPMPVPSVTITTLLRSRGRPHNATRRPAPRWRRCDRQRQAKPLPGPSAAGRASGHRRISRRRRKDLAAVRMNQSRKGQADALQVVGGEVCLAAGLAQAVSRRASAGPSPVPPRRPRWRGPTAHRGGRYPA